MIEEQIKVKKRKKWGTKSLVAKFKLFFTHDFFKSKIALWLMGLSFSANLINWIILKIFVRPVDLPIILHYNVYFGVDSMGNWKKVFISPIIGLFLFIINTVLAIYFYEQKERIASYLLLMAVLMIQLSLIVSSVSIILINY